MKKASLIFYWTVLVLLIFLYYNIVDIYYRTISDDGLPLLMVVYVIVPLMLVLGMVRLWLLKPVNQRQRLLDIPYFVIPVLIVFACFVAPIWVGIVLSVIGGVLIAW